MRFRVFAILVLLVSAVAIVRSQQGVPAPSSVPAPPSGFGQSSAVDVQGVRNYLLGPGDVVDVRVFGQPDLNTTAEVDSDGNISSLPFLETPVRARCRTEKDVQKDIAAAYAKYIKSPQVSVRITERKSRQPATIFGAVRQPTRIQMMRKVRLNELMAASGGFTERASGTIQILHTEPVMCPEPGEEALAKPIEGTNIPLEIVKVEELKAGKPEANPVIRPGDYVIVTEAEPVYITGSVMSPQGVFMRDHLTLSTALAMVGGARKEAKASDVRIYRLKPGSADRDTIRVDLSAIKKGLKPDFLLQAFDVVEVPEASAFSGQRLPGTILSGITGGMTNMMSSAPMRVLY
jgi:polysaccharide export outer membrane protein